METLRDQFLKQPAYHDYSSLHLFSIIDVTSYQEHSFVMQL